MWKYHLLVLFVFTGFSGDLHTKWYSCQPLSPFWFLKLESNMSGLLSLLWSSGTIHKIFHCISCLHSWIQRSVIVTIMLKKKLYEIFCIKMSWLWEYHSHVNISRHFIISQCKVHVYTESICLLKKMFIHCIIHVLRLSWNLKHTRSLTALKYVLVQTFTDFIELKYYVNICAINAKQNLVLWLFVLNVVSAVVLNHMSGASVREAVKFSSQITFGFPFFNH